MDPTAEHGGVRPRLRAALTATNPSVRLQAALTAGTDPEPDEIDLLLARCDVEPDFFVRDMLTWALTRHALDPVRERLIPRLSAPTPQARSQALHTLSKIGDRRDRSVITPALLRDADDEVARTAWRAAAGLVPPGGEAALAAELATQLGRGDREVQRSLSAAFVVLGGPAWQVVDEAAEHADDEDVAVHAGATARLIDDPEEGFDAAMWQAREERADSAPGPPAAGAGRC